MMVVIVPVVDVRYRGLRLGFLRHHVMPFCRSTCSAPIRSPLRARSAFLALRVLAIMKAVARASPTRSLLITLLARFLTICASVFDLVALGLLGSRRRRDVRIWVVHHWQTALLCLLLVLRLLNLVLLLLPLLWRVRLLTAVVTVGVITTIDPRGSRLAALVGPFWIVVGVVRIGLCLRAHHRGINVGKFWGRV
jgi:hypothetical protein